jgi:hypothetical protein
VAAFQELLPPVRPQEEVLNVRQTDYYVANLGYHLVREVRFMKKKIDAISEAAAIIGADPSTLDEEQAQKILRSMVMSNESIRIRKAKNGISKIKGKDNE